VLVIQHEADAGPGLLGDALLAAGLRVDVWCAEDGASLPRQLGFYAGLAVLGGRMSANDTADFPYLEAVKDLIRDAAGRRVPALGICLGAQLAAAALGGRVMPRPAGPRIGWRAAVGTSRADSLTAGLDNGAQLFCWHGDCYEPPSGAVPLLEDWDAFRVGSVCAFQPHPEVTAAIIQAWCSSDVATNQLARAGTTAGLVMEDSAIHERHGLEILERWCLEVSSCAASSE
jgi:GMP synthase-like glutamine amidotransferase